MVEGPPGELECQIELAKSSICGDEGLRHGEESVGESGREDGLVGARVNEEQHSRVGENSDSHSVICHHHHHHYSFHFIIFSCFFFFFPDFSLSRPLIKRCRSNDFKKIFFKLPD